tara:strand:- start:2472 stop:3452 length:981 start_codon:yes stop_codon:yes gene_type:complete
MESNRVVNVVGWYGKNNVGDESYKLAYKTLWPNENLVFSDEPVEADYHILGGGDIVSPSFTKNKFDSVMSVSFPAHANPEQLKDCERIWVRDELSLSNAENLGLKAELVPDFAFALRPNPADGLRKIRSLFKSEELDLYSQRIAVVINSHVSAASDSLASKYIQFERFAWEIASLADNFPASFIFIPFGTSPPWDDRSAAASAASKCKFWKKNCCVYNRLSVQETLDVLSACDAAISMRLHSSIFCTVGHTPFLDITHNHKNPNFLKTIGKQDWSIPYGSFCKESAKTKLMHRLERQKEDSKSLREISDEQRERLRNRANSVSFLR